ncbi:MAG TPA: UDP-3-O-acyl-N-acetylglucosamine deacetylase, partial [Acetobacteraceae bacterium]|nr:UDP-3-O-acyl-N-acetylglucosamine deacetylase [Acetobacteraceae bacterium]
MHGTFPSVPHAQARQRTLLKPIGCTGVGLHSGVRLEMELSPAPADSGIVFYRSDVGVEIPAHVTSVSDTRLATQLAASEAPEVRIGTVEHLLAAFAALGVDNARVSLDGPEVPVLDGSAAPFVFLVDCAGLTDLDAPRRELTILRPVTAAEGDAFVELLPHDAPGLTMPGLTMEVSIDFAQPAIGHQALSLALTEATFRREIAAARTFTTADAIDGLRAAGLARGGSLENAVVVENARILNPAGLRMPDEFVRHKLLDAVGDLSLAGLP